MNDSVIRAALKKKVLNHHLKSSSALVIDELGLNHGACRVDIAVVNGKLHGYEIKSDRDTLVRLPEQIRVFNKALDRITLIVGWRHVVSAMRVVPAWWGVSLVERGPRGGIHFTPLRCAQPNPNPDPLALVALLWRGEAVLLLQQFDSAIGIRNRSRSAIYKRLVDAVPDYSSLRSLVCQQLRMRVDWRPASQSELCGD